MPLAFQLMHLQPIGEILDLGFMGTVGEKHRTNGCELL
jgi:hypothetical protein